jgi:outer membrane protein OmpA-like peptidoglycan-associated protein
MNVLVFTKKLPKIALLLLIFLMTGFQTIQAESTFYDYLPKYRKFKSHYQIDKIEYNERRTVIYFRFVVQESGNATFYSGAHPSSWYLRTPPRMRGVEIQFKQLELANIAINNEVKLQSLTTVPEISYDLKRGDVVTCQVHFVRIPNYIRMLDFIQGKEGDLDQDKHNCYDIMIKTKENPLLGRAENSDQVVQRFEKSFNYIKPKIAEVSVLASIYNTAPRSSTVNTTTRPSASTIRPSTVTTRPNTVITRPVKRETVDIGHARPPEPIDYMPGALSGVGDLECNTRVYLPNVVFKENEIKFSGRVKAIQNIRVVVSYMKDYPDARINLYGHTDIHGSKRKNLDLSRERALSVKRELVNMGIDSKKISVFFFGGEEPLMKYRNGGTANRRVEAEPICPKK